jgi:hypothetical protein
VATEDALFSPAQKVRAIFLSGKTGVKKIARFSKVFCEDCFKKFTSASLLPVLFSGRLASPGFWRFAVSTGFV